MDLSRRNFLAGVGIAGVAAAGAGLVGCSDGSDGAKTGVAGSTAPADEDLLYTARINPQDYDYRSNTTDFKTLFSPISIGSMEISNRMVKSAAGSACYLSGVADELIQYYVNFAKGGVELIWIEGEAFSFAPDGSGLSPEGIELGKSLVAACAEYGAHLGYQWAVFGTSVAEADMDVATIQAIEDAGVTVAKALKEMGFEAIEINAAGFNQGEMFLSRFHNARTDDYGGSIENRARFVTECITKIKQACGDDFNVQVLIDCIEENDNLTNNATLMNLDNTLTVPHNLVTGTAEGIEFAKLFEAAGADAMHLRLGPLGNHPCQFGSDLYFILNGIEGATGYGTQWDFNRHWEGKLIGDHSGAGMLLDVVAEYKQQLKIPVGTVTYMDPAHAPDFFEQALADGKVDFYIMNRPLTVDPDYVDKLRDGKIDEIAPCTRCLHCHIGSNQLNAMMGYCRVNALTQRVMREGGPASYELPEASASKKVMVIGGGPAGMEAARIAAFRGHKVTLFEKNAKLGGLLTFAHLVKGEHENLTDLEAYLEHQLELSGVDVKTGQEADADLIASEAPDAVVLACGGVRVDSGLDASFGVPIVAFDDFMTTEMGDDVVVMGSNAQAFDAALWLTVHKKRVVMVTAGKNEELDMQQSQHAMRFMTTALYALGVRVFPEASIAEVGDGRVVIKTGQGLEVTVAADAIVDGAEMQPNTALVDGLSNVDTYAVGDAAAPFNIAMAIRSGNDAGRAI